MEAVRTSLDEDRHAWESKRSEQAAYQAIESEELSSRQVEFNNRLGALEELQAEWESEKDRKSQADLANRAAELSAPASRT